METDGKFYLGRLYDMAKRNTTDKPLLYQPEDLTTHAVVVGMTGSGKTGLCIDLLEEAALTQLPAMMIDPKGDITNLLLHFPELAPEDFKPWINPDEARRAGISIDQAAANTAATWKKGLGDWGIEAKQIDALKNAAHFTIYTPGSDAGVPVSILASLAAPSISWEENEELLREKISGTVTALLSLVGLEDIDPIRSREHILLSNIFEYAWSQGKDLDLSELILQTENPPFTKLGVFETDRFYPAKDRFELAMLLNNILAAPAFQTWIMGEPLDISSLLYAQDGKPRHSIFYVAHLSDQERMFFITLLYSAIEAWMRSQPGTTSLRAIVYFDEIFGYLPAVKNPPSKIILLRLLKQARAFGVAQVLVTQNPVDLDYKALSNAGTWMIGKLQTERDKMRLLDGLEGAMAGSLDRNEYDRLLSGLGKRVFLMHNVHKSGPQLFQTRWAMNYLAGPLTRTQIPALNQLAGAEGALAASSAATLPSQVKPSPTPATAEPKTKPRVQVSTPTQATVSGTSTRPAVPPNTAEVFLRNNLSLTAAFEAAGRQYPASAQSVGIIYKPVLLASAGAMFLKREYNLDYELKHTVLVPEPDRRGVVRWENYMVPDLEEGSSIDDQPVPGSRFSSLDAPLSDAKLMSALEKDFLDWMYRTSQVQVRANEKLDVYAGPEVSQGEFRSKCMKVASLKQDQEARKITDSFESKIDSLRDKMAREQRELDQDKAEYSQRKMEEVGSGFDTLLGMLGGRKRSISKNLTKRRMTATAKSDVDESIDAIAEYKKQITDLEAERDAALKELAQSWEAVISETSEIKVTPLKKDVKLDLFGIAWYPYYQVQIDRDQVMLPGFQQ
jgi:hypothetical protein